MKDVLEKKYYKISEVADMLNIPASTLRFWENKFTVITPRRNDKGSRFYTPADVEKIRMVWYLVKEKGMKLQAAQAELKRNPTGISQRVEALETLRDIRNRLSDMIALLEGKG